MIYLSNHQSVAAKNLYVIISTVLDY